MRQCKPPNTQYGNIPHAQNVPSHAFLQDPDAYISRWRAVPTLIFHCALSQVRGPKCAQRYVSAVAGMRAAGAGSSFTSEDTATLPPDTQQVLVLRGGFEEWQRRFKHEAGMVENYDAAYWSNPW
jgi:hypothetical protein